jgi:recombination protein RecA
MASTARAARTDLETLLRARKLDRTLTTAFPAPGPLDEHVVAQTGVAVLDERLNGGLPRGQMSEVVGARSSGRASLLFTMLASATARGEIVALVDTLDMFDAASAAACGIDLRRLLWIRGQGPAALPAPCPSGALWDRAVDRAVKALNLVLQAGGFGLVALDLAEVPLAVVRRLPFTIWLRLQRVIEGSDTACVLLGATPVARSAGGVTIALQRSDQSPAAFALRASACQGGQHAPAPRTWHLAPGTWHQVPGPTPGDGRRARLFLGLEIDARLSRACRPETTPCRFRVGAATWPLAPGS